MIEVNLLTLIIIPGEIGKILFLQGFNIFLEFTSNFVLNIVKY